MGQSRRRQFLIASGALLVAPFARAQPARRFRVGCLWTSNETVTRPLRAAFLEGMRDHGYVLGRNLVLEVRYAAGDQQRLLAFAEELVALKPDVLAAGTDAAGISFRRKTTTIPIVLVASANPVASGLVQSFARPGINVTGQSFRLDELTAKWFELLLEINPKLSCMGFFGAVFRPGDPSENVIRLMEQNARNAAGAKRLKLVVVGANSAEGAREAFARLKIEGVEGLVVAPTGASQNIRDEIIAGARHLRIPSVSGLPAAFAEEGGLATYGPNYPELYRRAAKFIDLILKGAKPADLPIEQFDKVELVVNLKTAREIGLTIPKTVLFRADRVIE